MTIATRTGSPGVTREPRILGIGRSKEQNIFRFVHRQSLENKTAGVDVSRLRKWLEEKIRMGNVWRWIVALISQRFLILSYLLFFVNNWPTHHPWSLVKRALILNELESSTPDPTSISSYLRAGFWHGKQFAGVGDVGPASPALQLCALFQNRQLSAKTLIGAFDAQKMKSKTVVHW